MNRGWLWSLAAVIVLAVGSYSLYRYLAPVPLPDGILYGNGHVEGTEVRVAAEVGGQVLESALVEGETVATGDWLARIDPADYQIALKQAQADILTLHSESTALEDELATWRHHGQTAQREFERYSKLRAQSSISAERLDQVADRRREARGRIAALQAKLALQTAPARTPRRHARSWRSRG